MSSSGSTLSGLKVGAVDGLEDEVTALAPETYSSAFTQSDGTTYQDVDSIYETFFSPTSSSSTIYGAFKVKLEQVIEEVEGVYDPVSEAATIMTTANSNGGTGSFDVFFSELTTGMDSFARNLEKNREKTADNFDFSSSVKAAKSGLQIPPLLFLAIPGLLLVTILPQLLCNVAGCRKFMYLICFLLFIVTLLAFLLLIVFGILNPVIPQACPYLDEKLTTK